MSIGDILLGESPSSATQTLSTLSPNQEEVSDIFAEFARSGGGPVSGTVVPFTGETSAPAPAATTTSLAALETLAQQIASGTGVGQTSRAGRTALEELLTMGPTDINKYFETSVRDPLLEIFREDTIPDIGKRFSGSFFGSDRMGAESDARETLIETMGRERARIAFEAREADQNRKVQALQQLSQVTGLDASMLNSIIQSAEVGRRPEKERVEGIRDEFIRRQEAAEEKARLLLSFLGTTQMENIVTVDPGSQGIAGDIIGAVGSVLGGPAGAAVFD